jgi:hypothetical protein
MVLVIYAHVHDQGVLAEQGPGRRTRDEWTATFARTPARLPAPASTP